MRLDKLLVLRGAVDTEKQAQALIMAGEVRINGRPRLKPGEMIPADASLEFSGTKQKYASRAGLKLDGALEDFAISAAGCICLDIGASTGGFTDCLLQHGAKRVYAVDVNTAQLDWKLRHDPRVVAIKKNARYLTPKDIPETADCVTIDVSFISLTKILPAAAAMAKPGATFLILVKPQFELPRSEIGQGGIVSDPALHDRAVIIVRTAAERMGLEILGVKPSGLVGAEGNQEFFIHARRVR